MLNTGFQNTPLLSIAICVTPSPVSQSAKCRISRVVVPNVRTSLVGLAMLVILLKRLPTATAPA